MDYLHSPREFGRSAFARGSYLTGRFADYGKPRTACREGWIKLEVDRLILPDSEIPLTAKIISVRPSRSDEEGKIIDRGHAKRDALGWSLPILWPVNLIRLPARGPRPTLSARSQ